MVRALWRKLQTTVTGGAILVSSSWFVSKLLGFLRERMIAAKFGASFETDAYNAAFGVPDFIYGTLILGSLLSVFIPVFIRYRQQEATEAFRVANSILNVIILIFLASGLVLFVFAPQIISLIAPGFDSGRLTLATTMTRIIAVNILLFGVSNVLSGMLNAARQFLAFSIAPVLYNLGIISGIVWLVPTLGIVGVAVGAIIGAVLHVLVQVPAVVRTGFRYQAVLDLRHAGVREIGRLIVPRAFGQSVTQLDQLINLIIGSTLAIGSVTIFRWATNIQDLPVTLIGVSLATVVFPVFSEALARDDRPTFVEHFSRVIRQILFLIIPLSVLFLLLRAQAVRVILGAGRFDWPATILTANTLGFFALSFFAQSLIPVLARSFYALRDTATPVKITVVAVVLNILGSLLLTRGFSLGPWDVPALGVRGLALAYSISSVIGMLLMYLTLRVRLGDLDDDRVVRTTVRVLLASALMALVVQGAKYTIVEVFGVTLATGVGVLTQLLVSGVVGGVAYLAFAVFLRLDEVTLIRDWLSRARFSLFNGRGTETKLSHDR
ncbi:MAG: murein biosynthesis integral membrane protein MurJ [Candidatus Kerfeldbacteria bacterium]|nr:murein biosynthesis integral membrane protein MurJ [Candidatus Kerfeldbacteria bacterium]